MRPSSRSRVPSGAKALPAPRVVLSAVLWPCAEGGFTALCPEIKGAVSEGETRQEALDNLFDAVQEIWAATAEMALEQPPGPQKGGKRLRVKPIKSPLMELCEAR